MFSTLLRRSSFKELHDARYSSPERKDGDSGIAQYCRAGLGSCPLMS
jgi:hypothetical protein